MFGAYSDLQNSCDWRKGMLPHIYTIIL
jgi:hypothetical protein